MFWLPLPTPQLLYTSVRMHVFACTQNVTLCDMIGWAMGRHLRGTHQEECQPSYLYQAWGLLDLCLGRCSLFLILFYPHRYHLCSLGHQQPTPVPTSHC